MSNLVTLVLLILTVNTVSSQVVNTTQYGNFTITWEIFNTLTCAIPISINISIFTCLPPAYYAQADDQVCLSETTVDFDQSTCQSTTTAMMYTSSAAITTATTGLQTASHTSAMTSQPKISTGMASYTPATVAQTSSSTTAMHTTQASGATVATTSTVAANGYNSMSTTALISVSTMTTIAGPPFTCSWTAYIGIYCNVSSDACSMIQPCLNAATCFPNHTLPYGYYCICQTGYTGYNCQYDDRACKENTCWHNGTCVPMTSTIDSDNGTNFRCICTEGYQGVYCQLQVDYCVNITCENRGICMSTDLSWKCQCLDSSLYYGDHCQYKTTKLRIREILSKSFASVAIGVLSTTCGFILIMDILKYCFHIDPAEYERESYRKRLAERRHARRQLKDKTPKFALRFQYVPQI